ncbi:hypothetical protein FCE95_14840 [Luteimonas gilva]|uniref:Glycosyltransferase RgtA/B/C/D-like domain-containing protein n=1 Tax=Luteimonas gilva TaxID=2572684 RepID=A0A4V5ZPK8_9GAMM|nr:hypothetical protein [Luteimonas gilva]TKR29423.1 hypothetical protein FCE95_14840 [Luteimonas gilva]
MGIALEPVTTRRLWTGRMLLVWVFLAVLLAQSPLIFNPGYFSHDELQWAAFAAQDPRIWRVDIWAGVQSFQYRPLTFTLWLWLSQHLFAHPYAFHAVAVAMGAANAALLAALLRGWRVSAGGAFAAAMVFALGAYAAHTHGWVAALADLIWVGCGLAIGAIVQRARRAGVAIFFAFALTAAALLAKEAAVVIPVLLGLAWLFFGRDPAWGRAALASALPVAIYLALRIGVLLFSPREAANYGWDLAFIPQRWLEYQLFAPNPTKMEAGGTLARGFGDGRVLAAAALWLALAWALWRAGSRWLAAFLLVGAAALGPVLILAESANQYGYGFAAATSAICAACWPRMDRFGKILLTLLAVLCLWHGTNIVRRFHDAGAVQAVFSPALADAVARHGDAPIRLRSIDPGQRWLFDRLTHDIPSYRGVPIGNRVRLVQAGEDADYAIESDGRLTALP